MKNSRNLPMIWALCLAFIMFNCKLQEEPTNFNMNDLVGTWKLVGFTTTFKGIKIDSFDTLANCQKDNLYIYYSDESFQYLEGETKCNDYDPEVIREGGWMIVDNKLKVDGVDFFGVKIPIVELTKYYLRTYEEVEKWDGVYKQLKIYERQ